MFYYKSRARLVNIADIIMFSVRVKHAVSHDTEVFQGEDMGKTPDG